MKFKFPPVITILLSFSIFSAEGQDKQTFEQQKLKETLDWLGDWLTYHYYNSETNVHWSNRFFYSEKDQTISLRSVSTYQPNAAKKKKVLDRTVKLNQLDAQSIKSSIVEENHGRIVEGTLVELSTIGEEREIQRSFDGRKSLKEYKLEIPIPKYYEDSAIELSVSVKEKLAQMIDLANRVYPSESAIDNVIALQKVFTGSFKGSNGSKRSCNGIMQMAVEATDSLGSTEVEKEIIGFDQKNQTYYRWVISPQQTQTMTLTLKEEDDLVLTSEENNYTITILGFHDFIIEKEGQRITYHRSSF